MSRTFKVYQLLAMYIFSHKSCLKNGNTEWADIWLNRLEKLVQDTLPSGSGFDHECKVDLERSNSEKIEINFSYHHMDDMGGYLKWTDHTLTIVPSFLNGFDTFISGQNYRGSREYFYHVFNECLDTECEIEKEVKNEI